MTDAADYQDLLGFLYQCPVGLIEFRSDGTVVHINPAAVSLTAAAWGVDDYGDLYEILRDPWPDLAETVAARPAGGTIVEDVVLLGADPATTRIGATIVRIARDRLMIVLTDATARVELQEQRVELLRAERLARHRFETLERNASHLAAAASSDDVADSVTAELRADLNVEHVSILATGEHGLWLLGQDKRRHAPPPPSVRRQIELAAEAAVADDDVVHVEPTSTRCDEPPLDGDPTGDTPASPLIALPLRGADKVPIGALVVAGTINQRFDDAVVTLLNGIARQTGSALERAQLFEAAVVAQEQQRAIAVRLQRALLPERTVEVTGFSIATRVKAASDLLTVGGDWYDSFAWPSGEVAVVVGDVVGHDVEAAARMGRLRWGLSARAAQIGPDPERLLAALEQIAHASSRVDFATAVCVVIDPHTSTATYASAGHPPPVVVAPSGQTWLLDSATTPPVGVDSAIRHRPADCEIEPGSAIVAYTDGLVERRGRSIDAGIDELRSLVSGHAGSDPEHLAQLISDRHEAGVGSSDDDMIVMVVQWNPSAAA